MRDCRQLRIAEEECGTAGNCGLRRRNAGLPAISDCRGGMRDCRQLRIAEEECGTACKWRIAEGECGTAGNCGLRRRNAGLPAIADCRGGMRDCRQLRIAEEEGGTACKLRIAEEECGTAGNCGLQ